MKALLPLLFAAGCAYYRTEAEEVDALYRRARHDLAAGKDAEAAIALLDRALDLAPERADILVTRARLHREAGRIEEARNDWAEALRLRGPDPDLLVRAGTAEGELGFLDRAEAAFGEAIRLDPSQAEAWLQRARFRRLAGRHVEAEKDVAEARAHGKGWADPFHNEGVRLVRAGRPLDAESCFRFATELDPLRADSWMGLGRVRLETGRPLLAAAAFAEAETLRPDDAEASYHRGNALWAAGRAEAALGAYARAAEIDPTKPAYPTGLGILHQHEHRDPARAAAQYARALALDPEYPPALLHRASLFHELGLQEEAERDLRLSMGRRASVDGGRLLASILNEQGKFEAAVDVCMNTLPLCRDEAQRRAVDEELRRALARKEWIR